MAILTPGTGSTYRLFEYEQEQEGLPPKGTFAATIIDIVDKFKVERPKFENREQMEKVDLTSFLFGFRDEQGRRWKVDSKPMRISGNPKSALFAFLKSMTGEAPVMGTDYCEHKGRKVLVTVDHNTSNAGTEYGSIAAVSPLPKGFDPDAKPAAPAATPSAPEADEFDDSEIPF